MRALPGSLGGVGKYGKKLVTAAPSAIHVHSRPPEGRLRERSAYEVEARDHRQQDLVGPPGGVNGCP